MEVREISSTHSHLVNALVSRAFGYQEPHMFFHDFPIWASSQVVRLGNFQGETLLSHVGIRFTEMMIEKRKIPVALIGAVATDEKFRGKGLSTQLLKFALQKIDAAKAEWSFLWGSEHEFYGKLGFRLKGVQGRGLLANLALDPTALLVDSIKTGFTETIFQALLKPVNGIPIQEKDRDWVFKHKTVKWFYLDEPFAFVAYERGMDLKHIIHEMGGDQRSLEKLLYALYVHDTEAQVMGTPEALQSLGFQKNQFLSEYLCLARPLDSNSTWDSRFWISGLSAC